MGAQRGLLHHAMDEQLHDATDTGPAPPHLPSQRRPPLRGAAWAGGSTAGGLGSARWLSSLTFSWVAPLLQRGSTQGQLHQRDLLELPPSLLPAACGRRLWRRWLQVGRGAAAPCRCVVLPGSETLHSHYKASASLDCTEHTHALLQEQARAAAGGAGQALPAEPSLLRAIVAAYGRPYFLLGLLKAAGDALNFAGPLLLNLLLRHLAARSGSSHGSGDTLRLLGWQADVGAPAFGYACAALLAGSLVLKVRAWYCMPGATTASMRAMCTCHAMPCLALHCLLLTGLSSMGVCTAGSAGRPVWLPPGPDQQPAAVGSHSRRLPKGAGRQRRHAGGDRQRAGAGGWVGGWVGAWRGGEERIGLGPRGMLLPGPQSVVSRMKAIADSTYTPLPPVQPGRCADADVRGCRPPGQPLPQLPRAVEPARPDRHRPVAALHPGM